MSIGSSIAAKVSFVPLVTVKSRSWVRSSRFEVSVRSASTLTEKNRTMTRPMPIRARRLRSALRSDVSTSAPLLDLDQGGVDEQAGRDQRDEQDDLAGRDHAPGDALEGAEQAHLRHD